MCDVRLSAECRSQSAETRPGPPRARGDAAAAGGGRHAARTRRGTGWTWTGRVQRAARGTRAPLGQRGAHSQTATGRAARGQCK